MTCAELQRVLPDILEGNRSEEEEMHLRSCAACSGLITDLHTVAREARALQGLHEPSPRVWDSIRSEIQRVETELNLLTEKAGDLRAQYEPSPRVWNSIEVELRREGLIHRPQPQHLQVPGRRWSLAWLAPVAAAALIAFGITLYQRGPNLQQAASPKAVPVFHTSHPVAVMDDQELLSSLGSRSPAVRAAYESDLNRVNAYIKDAEQSAQADPNDEQVQQYLMDAYQQKEMVYQMALDRSLR